MKSCLMFSAAAAALLWAPAAAWADTAPTDIDELVVTASRTAERADRVGEQITVLNRQAIEAQQVTVISDLLARTPGVSVSRNGGVGGSTQLRIRGAESDQTVVLIDGVKLNDPSSTGGGFNFANLMVGDIGRIEVLRGSQSVLWGSQAIGGVVNLITVEPSSAFESSLTLEGGSFDTAYGIGAVGGRTERLSWRASAGYYTTDGISQFAESKGGREADGYHNVSANARASFQATDQLSFEARGYYSRGRNDFDGFPPPAFTFADSPEYGRTEEWIGYAAAHLDLFEGRLHNRLAYAHTETERQNFDPAQAVTDLTFDAAGKNRRVEYQGTFKLNEAWTAVFGVESERSSMRTAAPSDFDPNPTPGTRKAKLDGIYVHARGEVLPGLVLSAGVRGDDHGDFGQSTVANASAAWSLNQGATVLRASFGQGFKAPSLYQLGSEYGNGGLEPEESESWDAGVQQRLFDGRVVLSGAYFEREVEGQIEFFSCTSGSTNPLCLGASGAPRFGYYDNLGRTEARGVELQGLVKPVEGLTLDANYTWTEARLRTAGSSNYGKRLQRRPEHQAYAEATYRWPNRLSTSISAQYSGARFDDLANRNRLKSYTLVDVRASYPVTERVEVYGRVENLFDKTYVTIRNYGQPGRAGYVGVRAKF
jgi:vitamin B12 transporter